MDTATRTALAEYLWERVNKTDTCWHWTKGLNSKGYGDIHNRLTGRKHVKAHRLAWMLAYGDIPSGLFVCHRCDTPTCVRPDHLFLGTNADNVADMVSKGRHAVHTDHHNAPRGESHYMSYITEEQAKEILRMRREGCSYRTIAGRLGISISMVGHVSRRETWRHVA